MSAASFTDSLLGMLRRQFYPDNFKAFAQQRGMLLRAVLELATFLKARGVWLKEERYQEILMGLVQEVKRHGEMAEIRNFGAYFLHVVQQHLKHKGDRYYEEGKSIRNAVDQVLLGLPAKKSAPVGVEASAFVDQLAAAATEILKAGAPRRKPSPKKAKGAIQGSLL